MDGYLEKAIVLTPAIATFEKIISELKALNDDTHPELVKLKKEHDQIIQKKYNTLDNYSENQKKLIIAQCEFEIQQAQEEYIDLSESQKGENIP